MKYDPKLAAKITSTGQEVLREQIRQLDAAIMASDCPYCGVHAGQLCRQKPRPKYAQGLWLTTKTHHMARVRAGHAKLLKPSCTDAT